MSEIKILGTSVPVLRALDELSEYMVEQKRPFFAEIARLARGEIISIQAENEMLRESLAEIANMPKYDQDDTHRLKDKAKQALVDQIMFLS